MFEHGRDPEFNGSGNEGEKLEIGFGAALIFGLGALR
jgi:hypothetical protein